MSFSLARVLTYLVMTGIGIYAGALGARWMDSPADFPVLSSSPRAEIQLPDPRLSPADVVRLQVDALGAFRDDESAIRQCYVLASPSNRAVTGPLDRFTAMVQNATYGALVRQTSALVGQPVIRGGQATVLVTVLDQDRIAHVFRFFLTKQTDPKYLDCWMTDAVIPTPGPIPPPRDRAASPDSAV
jgi:hypothetical protein